MKRLILCLLVVILIVGTIACSEPGDPLMLMRPSSDTQEEIEIRHEMGLDESAMSKVFLDLDSGNGEAPPPEVIEIPSGSSPVAPVPAPTPVSPAEGNGSGQLDISIDRMIVRTGDMSLVVEDVESTMKQITALAGTYNGYVVNANSWQDGERMMANIVIRVAAEYFDATIEALRGMAVEVTRQSVSGQDVTEEYVDLSARLNNLEASEAQLLVLMEKAGDVSEILEVQRELTSTRGEIEQIKGRMQYLEQSSSTSLIQVYLEHSRLSLEFQSSSRNVKEGKDIRFYPEISGGFSPYSYEWDFGDGNTSTEDSPLHNYKSEGSYTVSLKVTDDRGNSDIYQRESYISVLPGWDIGSVADNVWNGLVNFGRVLVNIIIGIGIFSPVWIVILVILYFTWWRRRKKKKAD